mgnify:CR=1 FL=1
MDVIEFVKTLQRIAKKNNKTEYNIAINDNPNILVEMVKEWAKENPVKTRQDEFLKLFPNAPFDNHGVILICPYDIDKNFKCCDSNSCVDCTRDYWMQGVE